MIAAELDLPFRGPLHVPWMRWFLAEHAVPGVEEVRGGNYRRAVRLPHGSGVLCARIEPVGSSLRVGVHLADARDQDAAARWVRTVFGLEADPEPVDRALREAEPAFAEEIARSPGLRIPGSPDPEELILRAMIGQQISLAAARTHAARLAEALGEPVADPSPGGGLTRLFPTAEAVAAGGAAVLRGPAARVRAVLAVAGSLADGTLAPHAGMAAADLRAQLLALPGIGPWTADYVVLRYLLDPDTLLDTDLVVRRGAESLGIDLEGARRYSPWRSYAGLRLWQHALRERGVL